MREIGIGVIGTGFMGKAHAFAYRAVAGVFPGVLRPVLQVIAETPRSHPRAREAGARSRERPQPKALSSYEKS
jgi:predicted dehydrogenase